MHLVIYAYEEKQRSEKRGSWASCGFCLDSSVCRNVLSLRLCPFAKRSWDWQFSCVDTSCDWIFTYWHAVWLKVVIGVTSELTYRQWVSRMSWHIDRVNARVSWQCELGEACKSIIDDIVKDVENICRHVHWWVTRYIIMSHSLMSSNWEAWWLLL